METTVKERLISFIAYLGIGQGRFEKECGISNGYVNNIRKSITHEKLQKIALRYPELNKAWLLTGEGSMLKDGQGNNNQSGRRNFIRYWVDVDATGGGVELFDDTTDGNYSEMVIPDFSDCTDAMRLVGDSMYPRYKAGQILVFKEWQESFIEYGQAYLVITRTGYRMLKYLQPAPDKSMVTCVSENAEKFPPFEIEIESIHKLYIVKGSVEQNTF